MELAPLTMTETNSDRALVLSKTTKAAKKAVNVDELLNFRDVLRMAKAAHPSISLMHTKSRKTTEKRFVKSKRVEFKGPDGRYPDAIFIEGTDQEISQEDAAKNPDGHYQKRTEPVMVSDEILVGPVRDELYEFLRKFVGHVISATAGRNGANDITTVVIHRSQVLAAAQDLRLNFANFYDNKLHRSKTTKDKSYAGAINMVAFRKMLDHAVDKAISDKRLNFRKTAGKRHVQFAQGDKLDQGAVHAIKTIAEQRISFLFFNASAYAGSGRRVGFPHFISAKRNAPVIWDVVR